MADWIDDWLDTLADNWYFAIGHGLGLLAALAAFLASWWYCAATYGYLLGFGLGWLPSLILAAILSAAFKFLWGPLFLIAVALLVLN